MDTETLILFVGSAMIVGVLIAPHRGRTRAEGLIFTVFLGWIGVLLLIVFPDRAELERQRLARLQREWEARAEWEKNRQV
jgi:hypothetical protein